jgi:ABC-type nitrate/sulfonate/bicarbonate transport system permease component
MLCCDRDLPRSRTSVCQPLLSIRGVHLPYRVPALLLTMRCGAGLSYLLAIAYDYNVLGLGPD